MRASFTPRIIWLCEQLGHACGRLNEHTKGTFSGRGKGHSRDCAELPDRERLSAGWEVLAAISRAAKTRAPPLCSREPTLTEDGCGWCGRWSQWSCPQQKLSSVHLAEAPIFWFFLWKSKYFLCKVSSFVNAGDGFSYKPNQSKTT